MAKERLVKVVENGMEDVENMPKLLQRGAVIQITPTRSDGDVRQQTQAYIIAQVDMEMFQLISVVDGNRWSNAFESKGLSIKSDVLMAHIQSNSIEPCVFEVCYIAKNTEAMYQSICQKVISSIQINPKTED